MKAINDRQTKTGNSGNTSKMIRDQAANPPRHSATLLAALFQHHRAGIDADRTAQRTQTISGAGLKPMIRISLGNGLQATGLDTLNGSLQAGYLA